MELTKDFAKAEEEFLLNVAIDYVALDEIANKDMEREEAIPSEDEFLRALEFIEYLFKKYGKHLVCLEGPTMQPIDKSPQEITAWLKEQWEEGKYEEIHYGIWFDLDKSVIPPEFIPPPQE